MDSNSQLDLNQKLKHSRNERKLEYCVIITCFQQRNMARTFSIPTDLVWVVSFSVATLL